MSSLSRVVERRHGGDEPGKHPPRGAGHEHRVERQSRRRRRAMRRAAASACARGGGEAQVTIPTKSEAGNVTRPESVGRDRRRRRRRSDAAESRAAQRSAPACSRRDRTGSDRHRQVRPPPPRRSRLRAAKTAARRAVGVVTASASASRGGEEPDDLRPTGASAKRLPPRVTAPEARGRGEAVGKARCGPTGRRPRNGSSIRPRAPGRKLLLDEAEAQRLVGE